MLPKTASYSFSPACLFICLLTRLLRRPCGRNCKALRYTLPVKDCRRWQIWSKRCRNQDLERHGWRAGIRGKFQKHMPTSTTFNSKSSMRAHESSNIYTIWDHLEPSNLMLSKLVWKKFVMKWVCVCVGGLFVHQPPIKVCLGQLFFLLLVFNN